MSVWDKLDSSLGSIYSNYLRVRELGSKFTGRVHPAVAGGGRLSVLLQYTRDLKEIEALGFETNWTPEPNRAGGVIDLANLERIVAHPGVVKLSVGREPELMLDKSVPDIRANQVWTRSGSTFGGTTGTGVIVGIIDTGIDVRHPFFLKTTSPPTTRILSIWDTGLNVPQGGERQPDPARLTGATYGVEYDNNMIDDFLQDKPGSVKVRHRDCNGHGTHVASIAAGNGRDAFDYVGVAPGADLVVVKLLYPVQKPTDVVGEVPWPRRFQDAVSYVLNTASALGKKVVINCSFGSDMGPHDGLSDDEDFLTRKFAGAVGQAIVVAAGNSGSRNQHARIEFPAGGATVDIPFVLNDRRTNRITHNRCKENPDDETKDLSIQFYYPDGPTRITAQLQLPNSGAFIPGPAFGGAAIGPIAFDGARHYTLRHRDEPHLLGVGGPTIHRSLFEIDIAPDNKVHSVGKYIVRVTSPGALTVHVWCQQSRGYGFFIDDKSAPLPAIVHVEDRFLIGEIGGAANTITVAAYTARATTLDLAEFSSWGPLVNYGGGAPVGPDKPEIAAPGVEIHSASARDAETHKKKKDTIAKGGTSMAAPHVTGAIALLLQKNPALRVDQIKAKLVDNCRHVDPALKVKFGAGRLDAKASVDAP
jgi:subtilisin family serine protease